MGNDGPLSSGPFDSRGGVVQGLTVVLRRSAAWCCARGAGLMGACAAAEGRVSGCDCLGRGAAVVTRDGPRQAGVR
jgi:hypothetical protein